MIKMSQISYTVLRINTILCRRRYCRCAPLFIEVSAGLQSVIHCEWHWTPLLGTVILPKLMKVHIFNWQGINGIKCHKCCSHLRVCRCRYLLILTSRHDSRRLWAYDEIYKTRHGSSCASLTSGSYRHGFEMTRSANSCMIQHLLWKSSKYAPGLSTRSHRDRLSKGHVLWLGVGVGFRVRH